MAKKSQFAFCCVIGSLADPRETLLMRAPSKVNFLYLHRVFGKKKS